MRVAEAAHVVFRAVTALVPAALVTLSAGCASMDKPKDVSLAGEWRSTAGAVITVEEGGIFVLDGPPRLESPESPGAAADDKNALHSVLGTVRCSGTQVEFLFRPETRVCVGDSGTYEVDVTEGQLRMTLVRDSCLARKSVLEGTWSRVPAGRAMAGIIPAGTP